MSSPSSIPVNDHQPLGESASKFVRLSRIVGIVGIVVALLLGLLNPVDGGWHEFLRSYVLNFAFLLSISLGALFFVLVQYATGAKWSISVRRQAEIIAANLPILAVFSIPILVFVTQIYHWAHLAPDDPHHDLIAGKAPFLNVPFFIIRVVFYFLFWTLISRHLLKKSMEQDVTGDVNITLRLRSIAPPSIILFGLTLTFAAFDFVMSLNPEWFSTIFGVYYFAGGFLGFFAFIIIVLHLLQQNGRLTSSVTVEHFHDLGKYAFAFTVFWSYIAFSQYMLIWYANIPEETGWFLARQSGGWATLSAVLILGHFLFPFLALMSRHTKRRKGVLVMLCVWLLIIHWLDIFWLVMPEASKTGPGLPLMELALLVGLGGLYVSFIVARMQKTLLTPERDPLLQESLAFENY